MAEYAAGTTDESCELQRLLVVEYPDRFVLPQADDGDQTVRVYSARPGGEKREPRVYVFARCELLGSFESIKGAARRAIEAQVVGA